MPDNYKRYKLFGDVVRLISQTPSMTMYKTSNGVVQKIATRTFREKAVFISANEQFKDSKVKDSIIARKGNFYISQDEFGFHLQSTNSQQTLGEYDDKKSALEALNSIKTKDAKVKDSKVEDVKIADSICYSYKGYVYWESNGKCYKDKEGTWPLATSNAIEISYNEFAGAKKYGDKENFRVKDSEYAYKIKCGADMKEVTVKAGTEAEAKKQVIEIAKKLKYKGQQIKTKWDK